MDSNVAALLETAVADPYPLYDYLRSGAPVIWTDLWGAWLTGKYATAVTVLRDSRFSSRRFNPDRLGPEASERLRTLYRIFDTGMLSADPVRGERWNLQLAAQLEQPGRQIAGPGLGVARKHPCRLAVAPQMFAFRRAGA